MSLAGPEQIVVGYVSQSVVAASVLVRYDRAAYCQWLVVE
jgi:hypothetical protein